MDAHLKRLAVLAAAFASLGASYRTSNFVVTAPTQQMAEQIGQTAEKYRKDLAQDWLGHPMPNWAQPCPITAQVGDQLGAGGATSFVFEHGEVFGWRMTIQGSLVRILDSVLPHEVTHTIFATHFRQPLPRWADEGACTTVEHSSERSKQQAMLIDFLRTGRGIAFGRMFTMKEYPHDVMPLYSQGYSVARYLVAQGGKHKFLEFLADGLRDENWHRAIHQHYGVSDLAALQTNWLDWVRKGSPAIKGPQDSPALVAVKNPRPGRDRNRPAENLVVRGQSPGPDVPAPRDARPGPAPSDDQGVYQLAARSKDGLKSAEHDDEPDWRPSGASPQPNELAAADPTPTVGPVDESEGPADAQDPRPRRGQVILEWRGP